MQEQKICPYPGLRPFNEDESIFFRGREEHIEKIISQLEEKKFVMLTGASGDGKSSIVYAGVIPNARAGFFKAKFNNWQIADFRPERAPLRNMSLSLAEKLGYSDAAYVEKELGFGFSSLINLYKRSPYFIDVNAEPWKSADEAERKKLKRKAANLFILVDQFEEFFTNSENYNNGKASVQSQAVINLLLETAKIALAEDLPIYIICTMRSDYIGQCAAFRGLPEYIGFSQFFVPRLKRKEIHQVIDEPATLSGNTISNRLTETLINELGEGFDQLPVLQHALNQIWNQADKGNEEMDLLDLAKLSGLPNANLPIEDKQAFAKWFDSVPDFKKDFFNNPSLENVLNAHANELYQTASDYYNERHEDKISKEEACLIIKASFKCLTKIDDSRAVRNRMTLEEITKIINREDITSEKVVGILDVFRLQGNTFLKPFITSDESSKLLKPADVLDITHESLIRNWDLLDEWAKEEYENWINFQDFNKQMQRWLSNDKAKGYLLPIGPLTFFENWYNTCKPNKNWLARYDNSDNSWDDKLAKAESSLLDAELFIKKSSDKLLFTRYVLKHGARKLSMGLIYMIFLPVCIHYYYDYSRKQNDYVIGKIEQRGLDMLSSSKVSLDTKAEFLVNYERLEPGSFGKILCDLEDDTMAFDIAFEMFSLLQNVDKIERSGNELNPIVYPLLSFMNGRLDNLTNRQRLVLGSKRDKYNTEMLNKFLALCAYVKSYDDSDTINLLIERNSWVLDKVLVEMLSQPADSVRFSENVFNESIQLLVALAPQTDFSYYRTKLSPIENDLEAKKRFNKFYPDDKKNIPYDGYQIIAYLYATDKLNDPYAKIGECVDSIFSNYNMYPSNLEYSFFDIIETLSKYNNYSHANVETLLYKYGKASSINMFALMNSLIANTFNKNIPYNKIARKLPNNYYVKYFCSNEQRDFIWNDYSVFLTSQRDVKLSMYDVYSSENKWKQGFTKNDFNFYYAMYNKKRGTYCEEIKKDLPEANKYFDKAFEFYELLPVEYLNSDGEKTDANVSSWNLHSLKRRSIFLYPKILNEFMYARFQENGGLSTSWRPYALVVDQSQSYGFLNYVIKNKLKKYYSDKKEIAYFADLCNGNNDEKFSKNELYYPCLDFLAEIVGNDNSLKGFNDLFALTSINKAFEEKDTAQAFRLYAKFDWETLLKSNTLSDRTVVYSIAKYLAEYSHIEESFKIINGHSASIRRDLLIDISYNLQKKGLVENGFIYLDSLFKNNDIDGKPKFGLKLLYVLGMVGSQDAFDLCIKLIKDIPESEKSNALDYLIRGVAYNGFYFKAIEEYIPETVSRNKELQLYNEVLQTEIEKRFKNEKRNSWLDYDKSNEGSSVDYENGFTD
jgi:hypothetical protein